MNDNMIDKYSKIYKINKSNDPKIKAAERVIIRSDLVKIPTSPSTPYDSYFALI